MTDDVQYTTRWVSKVRKPFPGHRWLTIDEARDRWNAGYDEAGIVSVIDATERDEDGNPRPRWAIFGSSTGRIRAQFFTPGESVWRSTDYDAIDGRLWRWICRTFVYPDPDTRYLESQCIRMITEKFNPDGTGTVKFDERGDDVIHTAKLTDAPVDGFWLDRPAFGDWTNLSNPDYGVPTDPTWTPPA